MRFTPSSHQNIAYKSHIQHSKLIPWQRFQQMPHWTHTMSTNLANVSSFWQLNCSLAFFHFSSLTFSSNIFVFAHRTNHKFIRYLHSHKWDSIFWYFFFKVFSFFVRFDFIFSLRFNPVCFALHDLMIMLCIAYFCYFP